MYCSSCGSPVAQGLSYCNHCGAKLNKSAAAESSEVRPNLLVTSMVASFVFGLAVITMLMGMMKVVLGLPVERVLAFSLIPFLLLLIMEGVFIRLLFRNKPAELSGTTPSREHATKEFDAPRGLVLPEAKPSVTEHTTRAFDPLYTERK